MSKKKTRFIKMNTASFEKKNTPRQNNVKLSLGESLPSGKKVKDTEADII